jgi:hypothetical protein
MCPGLGHGRRPTRRHDATYKCNTCTSSGGELGEAGHREVGKKTNSLISLISLFLFLDLL